MPMLLSIAIELFVNEKLSIVLALQQILILRKT